jgi:hypothetical protein
VSVVEHQVFSLLEPIVVVSRHRGTAAHIR